MPQEQQTDKSATPAPAWSRRGLLGASAVAGVTALTGGLAGCSSDGSGGSDDKLKEKIDNPSDNLNKKGFPIVQDPISVEFMTSKPVQTAKNYNKVANWAKYQDMTNVKINWGMVPVDSIEEKRNLALSSGDYPEVFYGTDLAIRDLEKYGGQGIILKLNDLIGQYMPNVKKVIDENDEIRRGMTFPDDSIYSIPWSIDPDFTPFRIQVKPWIRGDWLDKFDMDVPTTVDEYHRYLKMVKSKQPNGKGDTVPYGSNGEAGRIYGILRGSFGIGNRGPGYLDADPSDADKVRFFGITDGYKALMEYLHKLYSDGLILKNIFSIEQAKAYNAMSKGVYGSTIDIAPNSLVGGQAKHFVPMGALKGPEGRAYNEVLSPVMQLGNFVMTDKCKHPVEMARWIDYFYSDAGAKLYFMGVKGKSYEETKDGVEYVDKIKHPKKGLTQDEARKPYVTYMGGGSVVFEKEEYFKGAENSAESKKAAQLVAPDAKEALKNAWTGFTYTEDEHQKLESLADDIETYVDETRDKFISGDVKLSSWDKYVEKIKKMGLDDYMEIQQAAYDRYRKG